MTQRCPALTRSFSLLDTSAQIIYLLLMESIPIRLHTPDAVFTETYGLLGLQEGCLVLEYESKDAFIGAYSSGVDELRILPDDVSSITFKKGLFRAKLAIHGRSMKLFEKVPGAKHGKITLHFKRKHRAAAAQLVMFLQHRLEELDSIEAESPAPVLDMGQQDPSGDWI
jgi:hypothetical protein